MKFYLAIAFAILMATAYGLRTRQDGTTTVAAVDTTGTTVAADDTAVVDPTDSSLTWDETNQLWRNADGAVVDAAYVDPAVVDTTVAAVDPTFVDTTTAATPVDTTDTTDTTTAVVDPVMEYPDATCDNYSDEYDNGNGQCTYTNEWCSNGEDSSTSEYTDTCEDGSFYKSDCESTHGPEWSEGKCYSDGCYSENTENCYECMNEYYSTYSTEFGSYYNNNSCNNTDGSTDCKLAYFIHC
jgi:hypothetical protein